MNTRNDKLTSARDILQDMGIKAPSNVELRLIESAADIKQGPAEEISFQHTVLCQTGLPYRATSERRWERRNGRVTLEVEAGRAYHPQKQQFFDLPLPFGPKARLIMIHLNSEAVRTRERVIEVEDSMTAYIRLLQGREPNGKEIRKFKDQLSALSAAVIRMATAIDGRAFQVTTTIVEKFDLWFPKDSSQRVLWPTTVELSDSYFQSLLNHAVPLDQRAVAALAHNAMALDIYAWLAQRLCRISQTTPALVPWVSLHEQFGHGYESLRKFRQVFLHTLKTCVIPAYPDAKIEANPQGLVLKTSPPPIGRKAIGTGSLVR